MEKDLVFAQRQIKALSVESRVNILKQLGNRKYTLSELSEKLKMAKPTIKEHLRILEESGLIKKLPSDNKWIYYDLTESGKKIIKPEGVKVLFMFAFSALATFILGFYLAFSSSVSQIPNTLQSDEMLTKSAMPLMEESTEALALGSQVQTSSQPYLFAIFCVLFLVTIVLLLLYLRKRRRKD